MLVGTTQKLSSISVNTFQLDGTTYHSPSLKLQALVYDILPWRKVPESDARSVSLSMTVKILGVLLDSTLSMENLLSQTS